jgi:hypothetical protein
MEVSESSGTQHSELEKYITSFSLKVAREHSNAQEQFVFQVHRLGMAPF